MVSVWDGTSLALRHERQECEMLEWILKNDALLGTWSLQDADAIFASVIKTAETSVER